MNVLEAISARRSIRAFEHLPVSSADVKTLLSAAVHAPSALNAQPWTFAIVQDHDRLQRLSDGAKRLASSHAGHDPKNAHYEALLRTDSFDVFHGARTLIAICAAQRGAYVDAAIWLAAENLMLAACAIGLGTCCIGLVIPFLNTADVKAELSIPEATRVVAAIVVGRPSNVEPAPVRAAPATWCWLRDTAHRLT
jgi:nitroreductase